jgi:ATP:ADP antiporter, AAA family
MKIERAELARLAPLGAAHALVMATQYVLKPVRNALFLQHLGVKALPYATIAVAITGAAFGMLYARLPQSVRLRRLAATTFLGSMVVLAVFHFVLPGAGGALTYAFYVAVAIIGLMTPSLVWLRANELFDARQARRLFGVLGASGIAGAVVGGVVTRSAVHVLRAEGLVDLAIVMLGASLVLMQMGPRDEAAPQPAAVPRGALSDIAASPLLRGITMMAAIGGIVTVIADVQYNDFVARAFATREEKAAFFGIFFAGLSAFAFLFQVVVTPRVLAARGVGAALLFLPVALGSSSLALVLAPTLAVASALKLSDGALRHSIHKSASEILLVPVSADVRRRAKLFLDASVSTMSEAVGALFVIVLTYVGVSYPALGIVSLALAGVWVALTIRTRRAYVGAFRRALERRELDLADLRTSVVDPSAIGSLTAPLKGNSTRVVVYALDMLAAFRDESLVPVVAPLLTHASPEVRCRAVRVLRQQDDPSLSERLEPLALDDDADVRLEATCALGVARVRERHLLGSEDVRVRAAALVCIAEHGDEEDRAAIDEAVVRRILADAGGEAGDPLRAQVARALARLPALVHILRELLLDPAPAVVVAAIESVGRTTADVAIVRWLIERLGQARFRKQAKVALASFGEAAVDPIGAVLADAETPRGIRLHLPRVLAAIPASVPLLEQQLGSNDGTFVLAVVRALGKLRTNGSTIAREAVEPALHQAIAELRELGRIEPVCAKLDASPPSRLVMRAVRERRASLLERIMGLLGLLHGTKAMQDAHHGLTCGSRALRASAIEFIDNVVDRRIAALLVPALEMGEADLEAHRALELLIDSRDAWLRACAVTCAAQKGWATKLAGPLARRIDDPEPVVREALLSLRQDPRRSL